jgi:hypothetical protein
MAHARRLAQDIADQREELRPDEQHRRLAILDDESDLPAGQPPVHRRHHHTGLDGAEQQLEIGVAVLAEIGDAFARLDAERLQGVGDTIGVAVEHRIRKARRRRGFWLARTIPARVASAATSVISLPPSLLGLREVWRHPATKTIWAGRFGVSAGAVARERSRSAHQPRDALSFSFCALMESRALAQSSSLQSRN